MSDDPCFSCVLPDCNDKDPRCGVRKLYRSYGNKVGRKEHHLITDAERAAYNQIWGDWKLERLALAAEGVRPFKRNGSAWRDEASA